MTERNINQLPDLRAVALNQENSKTHISPRLRKAGLVIAAVAGIGTLVAACSGGVDGSISESLPKGGSGEPKNVAVRALQALSDGNKDGFLQYVRPDERRLWESTTNDKKMRELKGCNSSGADVLVEDLGPAFGTDVTVVFRKPCGEGIWDPFKRNYDGKFESCGMNLVKLSGRWYLDGPYVDCRLAH